MPSIVDIKKVPFPFSLDEGENDPTIRHPRVLLAKRMKEMKSSLPPLQPIPGKPQGLLEKWAAGLLNVQTTTEEDKSDDSWLNSPPKTSQKHETPDLLKELPTEKRDLEKLDPVKDPVKIVDNEKLKQVSGRLAKLEPSKELNEYNDSLIKTEYLKSLMEASSTTEAMPEISTAPVEDIKNVNETFAEAPTQFIPALQKPTTAEAEKLPVSDPITPLPPVPMPETPLPAVNPEFFKAEAKPAPKFKQTQEKQSDSLKTNETHHTIVSDKPFNEICWIIHEHERIRGNPPVYVQVSKDFNTALEKDMPKVKGIPFNGYIAHVTRTGQVIGIPIIPIPKLNLAPSRIICISDDQTQQ